MPTKPATVDDYLAGLPEDRRAAIQAIRTVILKNLDRDFEEGIQYGMIGYYVPHRIYPPGYHCDPRQPLPFASLASQKNHMALYLMCIYSDEGLRDWFEKASKASGKRLDMGKGCVRFRRLEDVPLDVVGEAIRRVPAKKMIASYESARELAKVNRPTKSKSTKGTAKPKAAKRASATRRAK